jgi:hypothetical protein
VNKVELKFLRRESNKLIFTTDHERIKTVTYEAVGTEEQFENFLKAVLLNYYKRNGLID